MKRRLLYGTAIVLLAISVTLVIWQGSFNFGEYGPADPTQTLVYWAISSLTFLLMVTLGFILLRTALRLYVERRQDREGSRLKSKLVFGAVALSTIPALFLVVFSIQVLNVNLNKWFSGPVEEQLLIYKELSEALRAQTLQAAGMHAEALAGSDEVRALATEGRRAAGFLEAFRARHGLRAVAVLPPEGSVPLDSAGPYPLTASPDGGTVLVRRPVAGGGTVVVAAELPIDVAGRLAALERSRRFHAQLAAERKQVRRYYLMLMALITLFVLFLATWMARFLADQISGPISALLRAAGEVRRGNLKHRVEARAMDELAVLVRAFNEMTRDLDANRAELEARRRFTEAILENIPTGVISVASDGAIQRVNRALGRILPAETVARAARLEDLFSREDTAEIRYLMKRARRTGLASRPLEMKTEGGTLQLAVTVSALEEKPTSGFVVVLEDTSDLLRAQKAAAWHEVARRVAHEMKNPLTPIALSAERIARHLARVEVPPETQRVVSQCAAAIADSVESVKTLVDEFSQLARFPAAQPARCDLNEVVESAVAVFAGRLEGVELALHLAPGLAPVNIDREQFKRVVTNLVDNAAEAMQDTPVKRLWIATQPGAVETVELIVADTGCGVTPEEKEKLFLPYFSTKGRGTGLGLAIVNRILADHNAQIRVEDNFPAGTRFIVEVPVATEAEAALRA